MPGKHYEGARSRIASAAGLGGACILYGAAMLAGAFGPVAVASAAGLSMGSDWMLLLVAAGIPLSGWLMALVLRWLEG